ncbi:hypothetical protein BLAT2472_150015 [Burkholderia latens]
MVLRGRTAESVDTLARKRSRADEPPRFNRAPVRAAISSVFVMCVEWRGESGLSLADQVGPEEALFDCGRESQRASDAHR